MYKTVFVHLLNDFSGSPKVLRQAITSVVERSDEACLYIGGGANGFLSDCDIESKRYFYVRSSRRWVTLITYLFSQIALFARLATDRSIGKDTVIYVNTLLPFGASMFGKMRGLKVICHVHEVSLSPKILRRFLTAVDRKCSSLNLYVSRAHMEALPLSGVPAACVYNALDSDFVGKANGFSYTPGEGESFRILMIASLRNYKGINEFLTLAKSLAGPDKVEFDLVLNDDDTAIEAWARAVEIPPNITIHPRTTDTPSFYRRAHVLLNLSRVDQWIETFGLTILEAMAFGVPVIVPPVGGPAELVSDGVEGFLVDSRNPQQLRDRVMCLRNNPSLCIQMSRMAKRRAADFGAEAFGAGVTRAIKG